MRASEPQKARMVDALIRRIPDEPGEPVRIEVPGAPPDRDYRAIVPPDLDVPVVIYRRLQSDDGVDGDWLVTTLIDRDVYEEYLQAERRGLLDNPTVRQINGRLAGTIATISNAEQGGNRHGGSVPLGPAPSQDAPR
jgi:hypothetical protein